MLFLVWDFKIWRCESKCLQIDARPLTHEALKAVRIIQGTHVLFWGRCRLVVEGMVGGGVLVGPPAWKQVPVRSCRKVEQAGLGLSHWGCVRLAPSCSFCLQCRHPRMLAFKLLLNVLCLWHAVFVHVSRSLAVRHSALNSSFYYEFTKLLIENNFLTFNGPDQIQMYCLWLLR